MSNQSNFLPPTPLTGSGGFADGVHNGNFVEQSSGYAGNAQHHGPTTPSTPLTARVASFPGTPYVTTAQPSTSLGGHVENLAGFQHVNGMQNQYYMQPDNSPASAHDTNDTMNGNVALRNGRDPVLNNVSSGEETDLSGFDPGDDQLLSAEELGMFLDGHDFDVTSGWMG